MTRCISSSWVSHPQLCWCVITGCVNSMVAITRLQEAMQQKLQADVVTAACCIGAFGRSHRWEEAFEKDGKFWSRQMRCQFSTTNIDMENQPFWWYFRKKKHVICHGSVGSRSFSKIAGETWIWQFFGSDSILATWGTTGYDSFLIVPFGP